MKKFLINLVVDFLIIAVVVLFFGGTIWEAAKELLILYAVLAVIAIGLAIYIGWALTKAMNPKSKKGGGSGGKITLQGGRGGSAEI